MPELLANLWGSGLRAAMRNVFYTLTFKFAVVMLRRDASGCKSVNDYVALVFTVFRNFPFNRWSISPAQVKEEIMELVKILAKRKPKFLLEIGTAGGGTFFLFTRAATPDATLVSVDLPFGPFGGGYPGRKARFYESFALPGQKIHLLRMDSHEETTLCAIKKILNVHWLDFLFIDGDHAYDGVRKDFEMYGKLVGKDGIIAFHDIVSGPPENVGGVPRFWNEIKQDFDYIELVKNWKQNGYGIGIIHV